MSSNTDLKTQANSAIVNTKTETTDKKTTVHVEFNTTAMIMTIAFLGIYMAIYAFLGMIHSVNDTAAVAKDGSADTYAALTVLVLLGLHAINTGTSFTEYFDVAKDYFANPYTVVQIAIFAALFSGVTSLLQIKTSGPTKAILLVIVLGAIQVARIFFGIDLIQWVRDFFSGTTLKTEETEKPGEKPKEKVPTSNVEETPAKKDEVFNISNNLYTYEDAQAVCKSYGARLATYDEIEDAYTAGAEWTSYGWSDGQHAYFPTQKATWNELQKVKGHEHDLGRPGVNGGYFDNPKIMFGANCYGVKPPMSAADKALMESKKHRIYPSTPEEQLLDKKVAFFQEHRDKLMVVSAYNNEKWSRM